MNHLQENTNKGNSFVLPPCKDLMRDAVAGSRSQPSQCMPHKDSSTTINQVSSGTTTLFQDSRTMPSLPLRQPNLPPSFLPSFPLPTSPSLSGPLRHSLASNRNMTNFNPYGGHSALIGRSSPHLHNSEHIKALTSPISPCIPRKLSPTESDLSIYGRPQRFTYSDPESIVSPPMTPMTEMSEESPTNKDNPNRRTKAHALSSQEMGNLRSSLMPTSLRRSYSYHNKKASEQTKLDRRRNAHLLSEKKRREKIKDGMDRLKQLVPSCRNIQDSKAISKAVILRNTTDYLQLVLQKHDKYIAECKLLRQENEELRRLVQTLQTLASNQI